MNEERVQAGLAELRESMADMHAPDRVEGAVVAAFREHAARGRVASRAPVWRWAVAVGLTLGAVIGGWQFSRTDGTHVAIELRKIPALPAPAVAPRQPEPVVVARRSRPAPVKFRPAVQKPPERPREPGESTTAFVELPYAPPLAPTDDRHLVRVRLPRGAMRQFGMFVREDRLREPVQADFLLGQDGVARAVRLVNNAQ